MTKQESPNEIPPRVPRKRNIAPPPPRWESGFRFPLQLLLILGLSIFVTLGGFALWSNWQSYFSGQRANAVPKLSLKGGSIFSPVGADSVFVPIKAGTFTMGKKGSRNDAHHVALQYDFWIMDSEVSDPDYDNLMSPKSESEPTSGGQPVAKNNVSWHDARDYCLSLTTFMQQSHRLPTGYVFRLPTEAEWEYCYRGGSTSVFPWGESLANAREYENALNQSPSTTIGRQRKANDWGLYDMGGNVSEWCLDKEVKIPNTATLNPVNAGDSGGDTRILRGGHYQSSIDQLHPSFRQGLSGLTRKPSIGFRVVLAPSIETLNEWKAALDPPNWIPDQISKNVEYKRYTWTYRNQKAIKMLHIDEGTCYFAGTGGRFAGGGESVSVTVRADGYWYLSGQSQQFLHATAVALRTRTYGALHSIADPTNP